MDIDEQNFYADMAFYLLYCELIQSIGNTISGFVDYFSKPTQFIDGRGSHQRNFFCFLAFSLTFGEIFTAGLNAIVNGRMKGLGSYGYSPDGPVQRIVMLTGLVIKA